MKRNVELVQKVKDRLDKHQISQTTICEKYGISKSSFSLWLNLRDNLSQIQVTRVDEAMAQWLSQPHENDPSGSLKSKPGRPPLSPNGSSSTPNPTMKKLKTQATDSGNEPVPRSKGVERPLNSNLSSPGGAKKKTPRRQKAAIKNIKADASGDSSSSQPSNIYQSLSRRGLREGWTGKDFAFAFELTTSGPPPTTSNMKIHNLSQRESEWFWSKLAPLTEKDVPQP